MTNKSSTQSTNQPNQPIGAVVARRIQGFVSMYFEYVLMYLVPGLHPPRKKNRRPIDEISPKKQNIKQPKYRAHGDGRLQRRRG